MTSILLLGRLLRGGSRVETSAMANLLPIPGVDFKLNCNFDGVT